jgi:hypothetical protein
MGRAGKEWETSTITCMSVYTERSAGDLVASTHCPASMGVRPPTRDVTVEPSTPIGRPSLAPVASEFFPADRADVSARWRRPLFVTFFAVTSLSMCVRPWRSISCLSSDSMVSSLRLSFESEMQCDRGSNGNRSFFCLLPYFERKLLYIPSYVR